MKLIRRFVPDFRFDDLRVHPSSGSCTLQYVIRGTLPDGVRLEAPACIVLTFSEAGKVASLEEYLDTAQLRSLSELMSGVGAEGPATGA
jgi:ketosteroid isomerase-like protein